MTQNISSTIADSNLKPPYVLALDVGTSSTRALLFDASGAAVPNRVAQRTYELTTSNEGEVSVDADILLAVVAETIDDLLKQMGAEAQKIAAVALDTFWHSLLGVDADNHPLTPVITWEDTRPFQAANDLRNELDERAVHKRTGARFHASYWPAKLRFLAQSQPEVFQKTSQWISFGEYIHRRFLGHSICCLSMASGTGLLDTKKCIWYDELLHYLHIRPEQMPTLGDLHDSVQGLSKEYADRWPMLQQVPWFPALGDGATACIGSGCSTPEHWSLTIGTSSALRVVGEFNDVTPPPGLWLYRIDARRYVLGGALSEGGNLLSWLDTMLKVPALKDAEPLISQIAPDGHGLTILPFVSGERSLGWHADARMTIAGLSIHTSPADLLRAGYEALAYQLTAVYGELLKTLQMADNPPRLVCSGGALLSSEILQHIVADAIGNALYPSTAHEASARGAALLALEAMQLVPDVASLTPDLKAPVEVNASHHVIYCKGYDRQRDLYRRLLS
ncbi:MAG TPA: gluconokinase [Ktedonobacteraceae bacterium]